MDAKRFFAVPYDNRNDVKMLRVRKQLGGFAGYGRWIALLGILYDENGFIDMNDAVMRTVICEQLELDDADEFFSVLAQIGLIDSELYHDLNHVVSKGVCEQLDYKTKKSNAGKQGGRPKSKTKSTC